MTTTKFCARQWTPQEDRQLAELWRAGTSLRDMALRFHTSTKTVGRRGQELKLERRDSTGWRVHRAHLFNLSRRRKNPVNPSTLEMVDDGVPIAPVTLYNAQGREIGVMDPYTRRRVMFA